MFQYFQQQPTQTAHSKLFVNEQPVGIVVAVVIVGNYYFEYFFYVFHKGNQIGKYEYRVKRIPDPVITLGGKLGPGHINKGTLAAQTGIIPILKNFDFQARFVVKEYTMIICAKDL